MLLLFKAVYWASLVVFLYQLRHTQIEYQLERPKPQSVTTIKYVVLSS